MLRDKVFSLVIKDGEGKDRYLKNPSSRKRQVIPTTSSCQSRDFMGDFYQIILETTLRRQWSRDYNGGKVPVFLSDPFIN